MAAAATRTPAFLMLALGDAAPEGRAEVEGEALLLAAEREADADDEDEDEEVMDSTADEADSMADEASADAEEAADETATETEEALDAAPDVVLEAPPLVPTRAPVPHPILSPLGWVSSVGSVVEPSAAAIVNRVVHIAVLTLPP